MPSEQLGVSLSATPLCLSKAPRSLRWNVSLVAINVFLVAKLFVVGREDGGRFGRLSKLSIPRKLCLLHGTLVCEDSAHACVPHEWLRIEY